MQLNRQTNMQTDIQTGMLLDRYKNDIVINTSKDARFNHRKRQTFLGTQIQK